MYEMMKVEERNLNKEKEEMLEDGLDEEEIEELEQGRSQYIYDRGKIIEEERRQDIMEKGKMRKEYEERKLEDEKGTLTMKLIEAQGDVKQLE